jgi:hypothetical protein
VAPAVLPGWRGGRDVDWAAGFADSVDFLRAYLAERRPTPAGAADPGLLTDLLHAVGREVTRARHDLRTVIGRAAGTPGLDATLARLAALAAGARGPDEVIAGSGRLAYAITGGPPEPPGPFVGIAPGTRAALRAVTDACARHLTTVHRAAQRRHADLRDCDDRLAAWGADIVRRIELTRTEPEGM